MRTKLFDFANNQDGQSKDYLSMIENGRARRQVANFFEPSIISCVPSKQLEALVEAINKDVKNGVFFANENNDPRNQMNEKQLNSDTHKLFLKIIGDSFGKSAAKTMKQRKNLNIFNLSEVHVLHQKIFDNFGEGFVNRILNNDLTPQSLIIIKDILSDKGKMKNFKYYYDFYKKNIGESQTDFERMIRGYHMYSYIVQQIRESETRLTPKQKATLTDVFKDVDNLHGVQNMEDIDNFYKNKNQKYSLEKEKAKSLYKEGNKYSMSKAVDTLAAALFRNYYGVKSNKNTNGNFEILNRNPYKICKHFDLDEIVNSDLGKSFTKEEIELIKDMQEIVQISKSYDSEKAFEDMMSMCEKFEKRGNNISVVVSKMLDKIPSTFEKELVDSLSASSSIEKRAKSDEKGIRPLPSPKDSKGNPVDVPVYLFDGADFSFLSSTNYPNGGLSGNGIRIDSRELSPEETAEQMVNSWFEYENGTMHICCSYANQDKLANLEFEECFKKTKVTYFFDDAEVFAMGHRDIFSPPESRLSNLYASSDTKFTTSSKLIDKSGGPDAYEPYNEIDISRFDYKGRSVDYGGKVIPSGILCCDEATDLELKVAEMFTKYCVENGLKPKGWKMPVVVVKKDVYVEAQKKKQEKTIAENSEYFAKPHEKSKDTQKENTLSSKATLASEEKIIQKSSR